MADEKADLPQHGIVAIVPCTDIDASTAFYARLSACSPITGGIAS